MEHLALAVPHHLAHQDPPRSSSRGSRSTGPSRSSIRNATMTVSGNNHPMATTRGVGDKLKRIFSKLKKPRNYTKWRRGSNKSKKKKGGK